MFSSATSPRNDLSNVVIVRQGFHTTRHKLVPTKLSVPENAQFKGALNLVICFSSSSSFALNKSRYWEVGYMGDEI